MEDLTLRVVWPPIVPTDRDELVQDETALVAVGLSSKETAQRALGLNPEVEEMNDAGAGERAGAANSGRSALRPMARTSARRPRPARSSPMRWM